MGENLRVPDDELDVVIDCQKFRILPSNFRLSVVSRPFFSLIQLIIDISAIFCFDRQNKNRNLSAINDTSIYSKAQIFPFELFSIIS